MRCALLRGVAIAVAIDCEREVDSHFSSLSFRRCQPFRWRLREFVQNGLLIESVGLLHPELLPGPAIQVPCVYVS